METEDRSRRLVTSPVPDRQVARLICCKRTEREELCCFDSLSLLLAVNFLLKEERVAVWIAAHLAALALALADACAFADWSS